MRNLALKIERALHAIERERGLFKVKCLVSQDAGDRQWDLILWADWFETDELQRLNYLTEKIVRPLDEETMAQFNAIITFGPNDDNELLRSLRMIQDKYENFAYPMGWDADVMEIPTSLPQARFVVPLSRPQKAAA
jgi:hypothetical protein